MQEVQEFLSYINDFMVTFIKTLIKYMLFSTNYKTNTW